MYHSFLIIKIKIKTSSGNGKAELVDNSTKIAAEASFVRTIHRNNRGLAGLLATLDQYDVVAWNAHSWGLGNDDGALRHILLLWSSFCAVANMWNWRVGFGFWLEMLCLDLWNSGEAIHFFFFLLFLRLKERGCLLSAAWVGPYLIATSTSEKNGKLLATFSKGVMVIVIPEH